jgi:hypothetical protein
MTVNRWNALLLSALILLASFLPVLAADSAAVLGILEIRGLDSMSASAFELTKAAGQPMPKEMVSMLLYGALGTMPGLGIQPDGTLRALWLDNGTDKGGTALLLPVENEGADYLASLGKAGWKNEAETAEGIEHFTPPENSGMAWSEVYFLKRGPLLVAGQTADDVRKADAALPALPPILPVEGDVALQIRPAAVMEAFSPQISEKMDLALKSNPNAPPEAAAMGALYIRGYMAVAKQMDEFTLGLGVADGNLNIHMRVAPVAGSTFGKWFETVKAPAAAAAVVNLPGALYAETANLGDLNLLAPAYFRYLEELMKAMPQQLGADFTKTYLENEKAYLAQMSGDFGMALLTPTKENPVRLVEYVALKDSLALRALNQQMMQSANELMKAMTSSTNNPMMPFQLELVSGEPREYRGIPVDTVAYTLKLNAELAANWPKGIPTKFDIEMAWVPGGLLASMGDATLTDALVDRALDGGSAPLADLPAWKTAYPTPEADLVDLTHVALFDTIRSYLGIADSYTGQSMAEMIPAGPGNIESTSYKAMGGMMSRVRLSLADIAAVGQKVTEAKEKAQAAMMEQMQGQMEITDDETGDVDSADDAEYDEGNPGVESFDVDETVEDEEVPAPAPVRAPVPAPAPTVVE